MASSCGNIHVDLKLRWFRSELGFGISGYFPPNPVGFASCTYDNGLAYGQPGINSG
ncbi:MAG: hypothetical protein PVH12_00650 [Candidatus Bathyarchaeota archaeon]